MYREPQVDEPAPAYDAVWRSTCPHFVQVVHVGAEETVVVAEDLLPIYILLLMTYRKPVVSFCEWMRLRDGASIGMRIALETYA
jgi:hypothetical protein